MFSLRPHLRPLSWIALLAVLSLALLPTLAHALAFWGGSGTTGLGGGWAEVCTPQGAKRIAVDSESGAGGAEQGRSTMGAAHLQHCPLCALSLDTPALPPAEPAALPLRLSGAATPAAFLHAPHTLHAWRSAQPRGPPAGA